MMEFLAESEIQAALFTALFAVIKWPGLWRRHVCWSETILRADSGNFGTGYAKIGRAIAQADA
jgi:hypothetical protein